MYLLGIALVCVAVSSFSFAQQPGTPLTLRESVAMALKRSPTVEAARQAVNEAEYRRRSARGDFLFQVNTHYGYTRLDEPRAVVSGTGVGGALGSRDVYRWTNVVSQPIFTGGALRNTYRLAELGLDTAKVELELARMDLTLSVKEAYYGVLTAESFLDVARQEVELLDSQLEVAQAFFDVGIIPKNDLLQVEVERAQSQQDLIKAQNALEIGRSVFNILLRRGISEPVVLVETLHYDPIDGELGDYLRQALEERPEIKTGELTVESAKRNVRVAASGLFPQVSVSFSHERQGDELDVDGFEYSSQGDPDQWNINAVAEWKLWDWGSTWYGVKESKAKVYQAEQLLEQTRDAVKLDVKSAYLKIREAEKNIGVAAKAVGQAEENLRINEERYKEQVATSTDVLDALTLLTQARTNYYTALSDYSVAVARLQRAVGGE
jgi:outer membrane protein TolC